jgi:serine/threonine protein kinase
MEIKYMRRFATLLERALSPAQQKAQELGLKYRGFGYWQDPKTGKTAYKTEGEELVPIDPEKQQELDDEEDGITMGDPLGQKDPAGAPSIPAGSNVLGAPEPGMERPTHDQDPDGSEETGWDAGPGGDNMVNDQNKPEDEIPADTYVGSNNNLSWVAGPDGSNFKNLSFDKIIDEALQCLTEVRRSQRTQGAKEKHSQLNTYGAELVARQRRRNDKGPVDSGNTEFWGGDIVGSSNARKHAKDMRDQQQDASDAKKPGDPMERTSYWKGGGYKTGTAQRKARIIRHIETNAKTKDNKTKFWKGKGFETGDAEDLAKGARDSEKESPEATAFGDRNDDRDPGLASSYMPPQARAIANLQKQRNQALGGKTSWPEDQLAGDDHDKAMEKLLGLLTSNKPMANKGYTGAETKINDFEAGGADGTEYNAAQAFDKLSPNEQEAQRNKLKSAAQGSAPSWVASSGKHRANKVRDILRKMPTVAQGKKDEERVKRMNDELKDLLSDPSVGLDFDSLTGSGGGAFGNTYLTPDQKNIIKNGKIGAKELVALHKLKDSPYFPTLMNALFDTPFTNQSSLKNNPFGLPADARPPGTENYDFSRDSEDWPIPTARGTYAMSRAAGRPFSRIRNDYYGDDASTRVANIWRAREALHRAGISHNDMHGNNVFMDDEGNPTIIDLGLSNDDPMSAFQEALGGWSDRDYQLATGAGFDNLPRDIRNKLVTNRANVEQKLKDRLGIVTNPSHPDYDWSTANDFKMFFNGGIRLKDDDLKEMREKFDLSDEELTDLIGQLYDGLTPKQESELEKRMSAAYDQRVDDNAVMHNANAVRDRRGASPLTLPRNVVPSKNLLKTSSSGSFNYDD